MKALAHLSTMVKRELASIAFFEQHQHAGTVLFRQGDEGNCWYIILKGSVHVSVYGKVIILPTIITTNIYLFIYHLFI